MKLMVATNEKCGRQLLGGEYNPLVWASDDLETVAHYYEGCVIEIDVAVPLKYRREYVASRMELQHLGIRVEDYTYGVWLTTCPVGTTWYSFSANYLREHVREAKEIFPDLTPWNE